MKKPLLTSLLTFIIITISNAQTTAIPDPNFEQALIDLGIDTAPIDVSELSYGVYMLNMYIEGEKGVEKIIIK